MKSLHGDKKWYVTEKLEGQNISVVSRTKKIFGFFNKIDFGVCSHHRFLPTYDGSDFWKTVRRLGWEEKVKSLPGNWFLRGEHVGGRIQGNIYRFPETDIYLFDVYDLDNKRCLPLNEMTNFCQSHGFKIVPMLDSEFMLPETVGELLDYSNGMSVFGTQVMREGVIIRLVDDPTVSFKVKSPMYLENQNKKT
jgi:ATP-dependent RNA circularization protein (DNA/RNA ligase family)